jgi:hypothetical protein
MMMIITTTTTTVIIIIIIVIIIIIIIIVVVVRFLFCLDTLDIVNLGGLPLIVSLCRHFEDDTDITIKLVKVLSNISMQDGMLQHFFVTGKTFTLISFHVQFSGCANKRTVSS